MSAPRYRAQGAGPPIIFVHGNASTHVVWSRVIDSLSRNFLCISYDLGGQEIAAVTGTSTGPASDAGAAQPLSLGALVEELEGLRNELKLERTYLVGHSLGALVAAAYAVSFPTHLTAMGLLAAPAARTPAEAQAGADLVKLVRSKGVANVLATLSGHWYTDEYVHRYPSAIADRLQQVADIDEDFFIRSYELYNATDIAPWLGQIRTPTLVMTGEHARGCGAEVARRIVSGLPDAELLIFEGMKNGILTEIPERVAAGLSQFFAQQQTAA